MRLKKNSLSDNKHDTVTHTNTGWFAHSGFLRSRSFHSPYTRLLFRFRMVEIQPRLMLRYRYASPLALHRLLKSREADILRFQWSSDNSPGTKRTHTRLIFRCSHILSAVAIAISCMFAISLPVRRLSSHSIYSNFDVNSSSIIVGLPALYIPSQQRWRGYSNAAVRGWLGEWVGACVRPSRFALWARYRLQFLPNHFQTSHVHCWWWEEEPYWFWVTGSKVKVNFGTLSIRPCGHNTDYSLFPITFKLHM